VAAGLSHPPHTPVTASSRRLLLLPIWRLLRILLLLRRVVWLLLPRPGVLGVAWGLPLTLGGGGVVLVVRGVHTTPGGWDSTPTLVVRF